MLEQILEHLKRHIDDRLRTREAALDKLIESGEARIEQAYREGVRRGYVIGVSDGHKL